jgi:hypothetical protein
MNVGDERKRNDEMARTREWRTNNSGMEGGKEGKDITIPSPMVFSATGGR